MGYPCNDLIPAAILLDNPGITREEYVELLNQTHSTWIYQFSKDDPWDFTQRANLIISDCRDNHFGIHGLAHLLGLEETEKYKQKKTKGKKGIPALAPSLCIFPKRNDRTWSVEYEVIVHARTEVFPEEEVHGYSFDKLEIGDEWQDTMSGEKRGIVTEIMSEDQEKDEDDDFPSSSPKYYYVMKIKPFQIYIKRITFQKLYIIFCVVMNRFKYIAHDLSLFVF